MYLMRFDMRCKDGPDSAPALYQASVEMAAWGEANGCLAAVISEHHASPDGYLPSPIVLATAMAARTETLPIQVAALLVPLYDPVSLAEQMAVLDIISGGRVSYVVAVGYRAEEYESLGQSLSGRGRRMEESLDILQSAFTGEPFDHDGRRIHVTPRPLTPGGPTLSMGGNTRVAARRAARYGMGMLPQSVEPGLEDIYREACEEYGTTPIDMMGPIEGLPSSAFVAEDPDRTWAEIGPYLLHDAQMYAAWLGDTNAANKSTASTVEELRAEAGSYRIFSVDEAIDFVRGGGILMTQPLSGGIPPDLAWPSLQLIADRVLPALG